MRFREYKGKKFVDVGQPFKHEHKPEHNSNRSCSTESGFIMLMSYGSIFVIKFADEAIISVASGKGRGCVALGEGSFLLAVQA